MGYKWVLNVKCLSHGSVDLDKAHLIAKGFTQVPGQDFGATFALIAKLTSVNLVISLATAHSWPLYQLISRMPFFMLPCLKAST
ncbi:hypothetical protein CsSME_00012404 [Camellia sinensis var. sinensis]